MKIMKYKNQITLISGALALIVTWILSQSLWNALIAGVIVVILVQSIFNYLTRRIEIEGYGMLSVLLLIVIGAAIFYFL